MTSHYSCHFQTQALEQLAGTGSPFCVALGNSSKIGVTLTLDKILLAGVFLSDSGVLFKPAAVDLVRPAELVPLQDSAPQARVPAAIAPTVQARETILTLTMSKKQV